MEPTLCASSQGTTGQTTGGGAHHQPGVVTHTHTTHVSQGTPLGGTHVSQGTTLGGAHVSQGTTLGGTHAVKDYNAQVLDALKAGAQPTTVGATTQQACQAGT